MFMLLLCCPTLCESVVVVNWSKSTVTRSTGSSVLVAADPEWLPGSKMHNTAVAGVRRLAEAGASYIQRSPSKLDREAH